MTLTHSESLKAKSGLNIYSLEMKISSNKILNFFLNSSFYVKASTSQERTIYLTLYSSAAINF